MVSVSAQSGDIQPAAKGFEEVMRAAWAMPGLSQWSQMLEQAGQAALPSGSGGSAPLASSMKDLGALAKSLGDSLGGMKLDPSQVMAIQADYMRSATELWNQRVSAGSDTQALALKDRRFSNPAWTSNPVAGFSAAIYLLNAQTLMQLAESVQGDEKTRSRVRFSVQQWVDAAAPSNFLALNAEAQQKALETKGESLLLGAKNLVQDLKQGHVSQTDESQFEVGRNVATSEGAVVFENEFFQLIEFKPLTAKVHERPVLFVPACINKYYILDLQPENSVIRYAVEQGHRVFVVSWRNPDASMVDKTWDDYIEHGVIRAIHEVQDISGAATINTLGFCVGGTLLTTGLAVLAARGEQAAASLTLLTTLLDFSHTGILDLFIDETMVRLREMTLGAGAPRGPGLMQGKELAATFSFLRPNDLVWNYVVGNYLKGETPPPFDLLYWNSDSTNLPGPMYCWYLRNTYLENKLKVPGATTVCGESIDMGAIEAPVYIYGSREDHIVPWDAAYQSTKILSGPKRFVLGASGHIAGVVNPPAKKKRNFWIGASLPDDAEQWFAEASEVPGSWWPDWSQWLAQHAGALKAAPKSYGNRSHKVIEPAPGRYVKVKA